MREYEYKVIRANGDEEIVKVIDPETEDDAPYVLYKGKKYDFAKIARCIRHLMAHLAKVRRYDSSAEGKKTSNSKTR